MIDTFDLEAQMQDEIAGYAGSTGYAGSKERGAGTVLEAVRAHLGRYLMPASDEDLDVLALWAVHTHLARETYTTPRLLINSPMPGSGKTTVLEHLERLVPNGIQMATVSSPALLPRILASREEPTTLLIDEAEKALNPQKLGIDDILGILNSGYKVGGTRPVLAPSKDGGWNVDNMPTFAPVAMAGNAPDLPEDTMQRTITVLMFPANDGEVEESDWELIDIQVRDLGLAIAEWADSIRDDVRNTRPEVPQGCVGRIKERWLPLKRVAVFAGGDWPERVDLMIRHDLDQMRQDKEEGLTAMRPHEHLVIDLHALYESGQQDFLPTTDAILPLLASRHPERWGDASKFGKALTAQRLGRMLSKNYSIRSERETDGDQQRGYFRSQFVKAWRAVGIQAG
ncbi:DUF3631 domain-containing protein [Brachybacterium massiliense]|uniref:DUF3631 domain-containing protein n=1 Tax=Brachybacterium massiliense TaxID=1755098 RepID=UPI000B3BB541|nr:DUF3631 domain-containing protein [Brachybacterium massiliense]